MRFPQTDLEILELPPETVEEVESKAGGSLKIGIIGAGQGGVRIAEAFYNLGYSKTIGINTTTQDATALTNFVLMATSGQPGGAGKDPMVALKALAKYTSEIYTLMGKVFGRVDHIIISIGLGGGTGSGSVIPLTQIATRYLANLGVENPEKRVGVIAALPKASELSSPQVVSNAKSIASELSAMATAGTISPFILLDNAKIERLYSASIPVTKFFPTINSSVAQLTDFFNQASSEPSDLITFDGRDFQAIMQAGGHMTMGVTVLRDLASKAAITSAIQRDFERTLVSDDFDLSKCQTASVVIVAGRRLLDERVGLMEYFDHVYDTIGTMLGGATIFRGLYPVDGDDKVRVYTLVGGLPTPTARYARLR